jgi:hypothetical protein
MYDDELEMIEESDDIGEVGGGFQPLSPQHFIGDVENTINDTDDFAKGYRIQTSRFKNDDKFQEVVSSMIEDGSAWIEIITHASGTKVEYLALADWSFYPVTPNIPSIDMLAKDITMGMGLATGMTIIWDETKKPEKAKRVSYTSLLVVVKSLYDHGYVDEFTGLPVPIAFKFNGYNAGDLTKALVASHQFVTKAVRTFKNEPVGRFKARGQEVLYTYLVHYKVSKTRSGLRGKPADKKKVGEEGGQKKCFIMENTNSDPKLWTPELEKELYCGDELAVKLRDLMYVVVESGGKQKRVSGGIARDFCLREIERNRERCRHLDPTGEFNKTWGSFKVPASWLIREQLKEQGDLRRAVQGGSDTVAPVEDARSDFDKLMQTYAFKFRNDAHGKELVQTARDVVADKSMDQKQKEIMLQAAMEALEEHDKASGVPF